MNIMFQKANQRMFGTFPLKGDTLRAAIAAAIDAGYRAFDTAQAYGNEADTGLALAESGIARDELCITTKVTVENFSRERFMPSVEQSLRDLR
ncbi:MAG: aldo/keto reductase, partial [Mesorhizobium sp.]